MSIRLVLGDEHPIILYGLKHLIGSEGDMHILACCPDAISTFEAVQRHTPDILILEINMPGGGGLELARKIRQAHLQTRLIIFTSSLTDDQLVEATGLGINGIVLKEMPSQILIQCIRKVNAGEFWIERRSAHRALEQMHRTRAENRQLAKLLTPREIDIVRLIVKGLRNREIADRLCICEGTVKVHLSRIYYKLKIDSRVALLRHAQEKGLT